MKPLMYGYLRAPDDVPDDDLARTVEELKHYAETEGFCYATTFFEYQDGSRAAFEAGLIQSPGDHVVRLVRAGRPGRAGG